jgi:hypothetical protein
LLVPGLARVKAEIPLRWEHPEGGISVSLQPE